MKATTLIATFFLFSFFAFAQQSTRNVPGVSPDGYWVVQGNVKTPRSNTVLFYTNNNELVYQETLQNVKLNTNRKKVRIKLQKVLESVLSTWQKDKQAVTDKDYVKVILK